MLMIRFISGYTSSVPLNHPRICYDNYSVSVLGSPPVTPGVTYDADVVLNEYTYERWDPSGGGNIRIDLGADTTISSIAIAAHSLQGYSLDINTALDGFAYQQIHNATETSANPLIFVFPDRLARYRREVRI